MTVPLGASHTVLQVSIHHITSHHCTRQYCHRANINQSIIPLLFIQYPSRNKKKNRKCYNTLLRRQISRDFERTGSFRKLDQSIHRYVHPSIHQPKEYKGGIRRKISPSVQKREEKRKEKKRRKKGRKEECKCTHASHKLTKKCQSE